MSEEGYGIGLGSVLSEVVVVMGGCVGVLDAGDLVFAQMWS